MMRNWLLLQYTTDWTNWSVQLPALHNSNIHVHYRDFTLYTASRGLFQLIIIAMLKLLKPGIHLPEHVDCVSERIH